MAVLKSLLKSFFWPLLYLLTSIPLNFYLSQGPYAHYEYLSIILIWMSSTWLISRLSHRYLFKLFLYKQHNSEIPTLLKDLFSVLLWIISFFAFLSFYYNYSLTGLWAASSVSIAILGFALRGILMDLFSGIAMGLDRPFKIGDWIEADNGIIGKVESMNWRVTTIVSRENIMSILPNSLMASVSFQNYGQNRFFRDSIELELDYYITSHQAERILIGATSSINSVQNAPKKPETKIISFGKRGVKWELRFWLDDYSQRDIILYEIQKNILKNLHFSGVSVSKDKLNISTKRASYEKNERDDIKYLLKAISIFSSFSPVEITILANSSIRHLYKKGATIIEHNEEGDSVYVLFEGGLNVFVPSDTHEDESVKVAALSSGDFFGEMSLLTGEKRSATVKANIDSIVYEIKRIHLAPILEVRDDVLDKFNDALIQRTHSNQNTLDKSKVNNQNFTNGGFLTRIQKVFNYKKV